MKICPCSAQWLNRSVRNTLPVRSWYWYFLSSCLLLYGNGSSPAQRSHSVIAKPLETPDWSKQENTASRSAMGGAVGRNTKQHGVKQEAVFWFKDSKHPWMLVGKQWQRDSYNTALVRAISQHSCSPVKLWSLGLAEKKSFLLLLYCGILGISK